MQGPDVGESREETVGRIRIRKVREWVIFTDKEKREREKKKSDWWQKWAELQCKQRRSTVNHPSAADRESDFLQKKKWVRENGNYSKRAIYHSERRAVKWEREEKCGHTWRKTDGESLGRSWLKHGLSVGFGSDTANTHTHARTADLTSASTHARNLQENKTRLLIFKVRVYKLIFSWKRSSSAQRRKTPNFYNGVVTMSIIRWRLTMTPSSVGSDLWRWSYRRLFLLPLIFKDHCLFCLLRSKETRFPQRFVWTHVGTSNVSNFSSVTVGGV